MVDVCVHGYPLVGTCRSGAGIYPFSGFRFADCDVGSWERRRVEGGFGGKYRKGTKEEEGGGGGVQGCLVPHQVVSELRCPVVEGKGDEALDGGVQEVVEGVGQEGLEALGKRPRLDQGLLDLGPRNPQQDAQQLHHAQPRDAKGRLDEAVGHLLRYRVPRDVQERHDLARVLQDHLSRGGGGGGVREGGSGKGGGQGGGGAG